MTAVVDQADPIGRRWLRADQAATHVGLSKATLAALRVRGGGPNFRKMGRVVLYEMGALDAWMAGRPEFSSTAAVTVAAARTAQAEQAA